MDIHSLREKLKKRPLLAMLGGFAIAGVVVGVIAIFALFWVEPMSAPEQAGTVHFHVGHFVLWYRKGASGLDKRDELSNQLQHDFDTLIALLEVDLNLIPDPIDVFVHDTVSDMQSSIAKRKSSKSRGGYVAPLDLLAGESPRQRLAELVLAFGWGQCGSTLLKQGMAIYSGEPQRNFHAVIAALPDRLYKPLPELILMENRGKFAESLYEQFDSPYSPASILFSDLRKLITLSVQGEASPAEIPALEGASFVQFLIETEGGIKAVRRAWGRGSTTNLLKRIDDEPIDDLGARWYAKAKEEGVLSTDYAYLNAYYLLAGGNPDAAWQQCKEWQEANLTEDRISLAVRCALTVGAQDKAEGFLSHMREGREKEELKKLVSMYAGWSKVEVDGMRIFVSPQIQADAWQGPEAAIDAFKAMTKRLDLAPADLPERFTLFFYPDAEEKELGASLVHLSYGENATLHLVFSDNAAYEMGKAIPLYAWRDTYSRLLREGTATALSSDAGSLLKEGRQLREEGHWFPLASVDFGMTFERTVEVEGGLLIDYIIDHCGGQALGKIWMATSPSGRYLSLDSALAEVCKTTRSEIEEGLVARMGAEKGRVKS